VSKPDKKTIFPRVTASVALVGIACGWVAVHFPSQRAVDLGRIAIVIGVLSLVLAVFRYVGKRRETRNTIDRWGRTSKKHGGVASRWDHLRVSSAWAMRRRAAVLKPSLAELPWWRRWSAPVTGYATPIAIVGRRPVWSPCEDVTLRVGGPRTGKTGELACRIVDAPGAVVATSTRTDIVELTAPLRMTRGPIHLFNPGALGGWASTVKWSPLVGCRVPAIAHARAQDMIPPSTSADGERWDNQARDTLGLFLHAAALGGHPMRAVLNWTSRPDRQSADAVLKALSDSREERTMKLAAEQFFGQNDRTRTSVTTTMMPALRWLTDSRAAAIGDPDDVTEALDVVQMLDQHATVYLLGSADDGGTAAPLIAAFVGEVARQARAVAATKPQGRLDPALTIALDEAALICPVPLDRWTADMGGRSITIHISVQSRAQLRQRWGNAGAATILNNTASILV
jgi:type IV secretion system protein VirD4